MKAIKGTILAGSLITLALAAFALTRPKAVPARINALPVTPVISLPASSAIPLPASPAGAGFAVVELFTSEGCSSCPSADQLVAQVQKEEKDQPVYLLAYHVDYWDRLGWKDAFSKAAYSDRQRQYANWLKLESVYTPQIIVNGKREFVGSQAATLRQTIEKSLQEQASPVRLSITNCKISNGQLEWTWHTEGAKKNLLLMTALVQKAATTAVRAGENNGRTLSHVQIVRNLQTTTLNGKKEGIGHMEWTKGLDPGEGGLIAFLQDPGNGEIVAAVRPTN